MKRQIHIVSVICLLLTSMPSTAQEFKTSKLKQAAERLGINHQLDSIQSSETTILRLSDNLSICVRTSRDKIVEHIGIPLFNEQLRILIPSPVYDFLEFAVLNWKYKINPNTLYLSKVLFQKGNWDLLATGGLWEYNCSIANQDNRLYIVTWKRDETEVAVIGIPIDYELLNNDNRRNIEKDFIKGLISYQMMPDSTKQRTISEEDLKIYGTGGLFVLQGEFCIMPELNQNVYYKFETIVEHGQAVLDGRTTMVTFEQVVPVIVIDTDYPEESFANLMMSDDSLTLDVSMKLDFHLSDYSHQKLTIPLRKFKDYCRQDGCSIYFASSGTINNKTRGILYIYNASKGYSHLLSLSIPTGHLKDELPEVEASVYLFIPPVDNDHLFGKVPTKKSGANFKQ